jgi:nucleotide-binding universal stress UspA family protein
MIQRILVAVDFSPISDDALRRADADARALGAKLGVCHVMPSVQTFNPLFPQNNAPSELASAQLEEKVGELLDERVQEITGRERGDYEKFVEVGDAAPEIIRRAEAFAADRVVVGSHGRTGVARLLLGSVAERVVRYAHGPVLVVRPAPASGIVLAATDLSDPSLPALAAAVDEAKRRKAKLVVAHAIDFGGGGIAVGLASATGVPTTFLPPDTVKAVKDAVRANLSAELAKLGYPGDVVIVEGGASGAIVAEAEARSAELVVVGTRGRTGIARVALGSVAESVIRHAHASVLAVRVHGD